MNKYLSFILLFNLLLFMSCYDFEPNSKKGVTVSKTEDLIVPSSFDWKTSTNVVLKVGVLDGDLSGQQISVYSDNPENGGKLLAKGNATLARDYKVWLNLPATNENLYVTRTFSSHDTDAQSMDLSVVGNKIEYSFGGNQLKKAKAPAENELSIGKDETYTIEAGETLTGTVSFSNKGGGILLVKGTANLSSVTLNKDNQIKVDDGGELTSGELFLNDDGVLIIEEGGEASIDEFKMNSKDCSLSNAGTLEITPKVSFNGDITNTGTCKVYGDFDVSQGKIKNQGKFFVYGNAALSNNINQGDYFRNYCHFYVEDDFANNNTDFLMVSGLLQIGGDYFLKGNTTNVIQDQSMITCTSFTCNSILEGEGELNSLIVDGDIRINGSNEGVSGAIEVVQTNGIFENGSAEDNFFDGATYATATTATNTIEVSECNPVGFFPAASDDDEDSNEDDEGDVDDDEGEDESDEDNDCGDEDCEEYDQLLTQTYFPAQDEWGTLAYEDLWPGKGDYDFNDLVIKYEITHVSNSENDITAIHAKFFVSAVGASYSNGFGFQIDGVDPATVASVTGNSISHDYIELNTSNGAEADQSNLVVIVYDDVEDIIHRVDGAGMFNTEQGSGIGTSDTLEVVITFVNPIDPLDLGTPPYNPFVIKDWTNGRGNEIHLPNYHPTDLADTDLFGTADDASGSGNYYVTQNNLPWALHLPVSWKWPLEKVDIINAYSDFAEWAQSGGNEKTDWYLHVNEELVFDSNE